MQRNGDDLARSAIWRSIEATLKSEIAQAKYGPGDKLPTEQQLAVRFGVNRHTIRRALAALAQEGLVHARRGAGVYVTQRPTDYPIRRRMRFHQNLRAAGRIPEKQVLRLETRAASVREAEALKIAPGAPVHIYEGLSLADDHPIALFESVFPAERFPQLLADLDRSPSVTQALRRGGVEDYIRSTTRLTAKLATATQALHLRIFENAPVLRSVGVNTDLEGRPVEYGRSWFAGDRVALTMGDD